MEGIYVTKRDDEWAIVRKGATRASRVFDTQKGAIAYARPIARADGVELRIQDRNGKFRDC